jgi:hypothetical protein
MDQSPTGTHQPFFTVHCRPIYKYVPRYLDFAENVLESCAILPWVQMEGGLCHGYI